MDIASSILPVLILLATGIIAAVASRLLRISPIVGYLVLGLGVSAVRPDLLAAGGTVHLLAELGVVFLLFDIGLHFSIAQVKQEAADIFGFGPLQIAASACLLGLAAWWSGLPPVVAFLLGATLALSSTAIVVGVIAERRQQNCPVALTATAILIFQDIAAIFLLILASTLDRGGAVAIMIGALASSFVAGILASPDIPDRVKERAQVELAGGVPFISDADLEAALDDARVSRRTTDAALEAYGEARIDGLRAALAILALLDVVALFLAQRVPTTPVGRSSGVSAETS